MEFKRIEVKRILRHYEQIKDKVEIKNVLESLGKNSLKFSTRISGIGSIGSCSVMGVEDDHVVLFALSPCKTKMRVEYDKVEMVEVENNCDFIADDVDDGGRWARLI